MMFSGRILQLGLLLVTLVNFGRAHSTAESGPGYSTLGSLHEGNSRFRETAGKGAAVVGLVEESPSFMFLGCTDNRLTPASIFQAPVGSIISQNNIGNQYSKKDTSTDAAITYAIEELGVQHIIVLGHYGCTGVSRAITGWKEQTSLSRWIEPIVNLYQKGRRDEVVKFRDSRMPHRGSPKGITGPPDPAEPGFRAVVEENVRKTVKTLKEESTLANAYALGAKATSKSTPYEVYVHGFVFEATGEVIDLNVSFGPPGKAIPHVPFTAAAAAKNFQQNSGSKRKTLPS